MSERIRTGVFGVGSLGQWHARIMSELDSVDFVGVFDTDPERAKEVGDRYGVEAFTDTNELAQRIQAASVVVPTHYHYDVAMALLDHDIHLMIEKPISDSLDHADAMIKRAKEKNLVIQVGHVERFNPVMSFLEESLSEPRFIEAIRLAPFPPPRPGLAPRGTEVSVVFDLMIHDLEIIMHLAQSEITDIHAVGVPVLSPTEDIANVRLQFASGCVANITASRVSQEALRKIRVFQADTYLSLDYGEQQGQLLQRDGAGLSKTEVPIEKGDALTRELDAFIHCVRTGTTPLVTGERGRDALQLAVRICEAIQAAQ